MKQYERTCGHQHHYHPNLLRYLQSPTPSQVRKRLEDLGVSAAQFERYYNIPQMTIGKFLYGSHNLPAKFWHLIFEDNPTRGEPVIAKQPISVRVPEKPKPLVKRDAWTIGL